jgi:hypothetical protein
MAKPTTYLLVGLAHTGVPLLTAALEQHRDRLLEDGVQLPARSVDEAFRAAVELRKEHRAWALRRKDVEGSWAGICRRALKHAGKGADRIVVGHELLAGSSPAEVDLLVDGLAGTEVHVVLVAGAPDPLAGLMPTELDLGDVLARWRRAARSADRVHVLVADGGPATAWPALGDLVGFDAEELPLPELPVSGQLDVHTLGLLAESTAALLDQDELVELVGHWAKLVAEEGYDVRGELGSLVPRPLGGDVPLAVLRSVLGETVAEVGRLRARVTELEVSAAARRPRLRSVR